MSRKSRAKNCASGFTQRMAYMHETKFEQQSRDIPIEHDKALYLL